MNGSDLDRIRRRIGFGIVSLTAFWLIWTFTPGLPVWWGPRASAAERTTGLAIFEHEWQPHDPLAGGDGLGPVFNARSCVACHFQGGVGGGGDPAHNVLAFEAHPTRDQPELKGGVIHKFAVENRLFEQAGILHVLYPIVPGGVRVEGGCQVLTLDFDPVRTESVNTPPLFGAGWIDRISPRTIRHQSLKASLARIGQELNADFRGIVPGRPRVLPDGRVGKFGWKAQFATLEEFVAAACANEIGLGNPKMEQAKPIAASHYPEVKPDLDESNFRALVAFVETLPRPSEITPSDSKARTQAERGKKLFDSVGCAACHIPDIGGLEGVYSDFLLHRLDDRSKGGGGYRTIQTPEVPLPEEHPRDEEWKTPPLWGVADSAPYFHDGRSPDLESAIQRHHGGAEAVTLAYRNLPESDREAIIAFLKTLKAPMDADPVPPKTEVAAAR